jgi:hypothetical protein
VEGGAATSIPLHGQTDLQERWLTVAEMRLRPEQKADYAAWLDPPPVFGDELALLAHDLPAKAGAAEGDLCVDLLWRAERPVSSDYHVSVQLVDSGGALLSQHDGPPYGGRYPTTRWEAGEAVPDRYCLPLDGLPGGQYALLVVVYRPADGGRLAVDGGADGALPLSQVTLE